MSSGDAQGPGTAAMARASSWLPTRASAFVVGSRPDEAAVAAVRHRGLGGLPVDRVQVALIGAGGGIEGAVVDRGEVERAGARVEVHAGGGGHVDAGRTDPLDPDAGRVDDADAPRVPGRIDPRSMRPAPGTVPAIRTAAEDVGAGDIGLWRHPAPDSRKEDPAARSRRQLRFIGLNLGQPAPSDDTPATCGRRDAHAAGDRLQPSRNERRTQP